jgi:archaellum component FlaC
MIKNIQLYIVVFGLVLSSNLFAFKADTHVWIAQEVINDVQDGVLSFELGEKVVDIPVSNDVVEAITLYPDYYRMGSVGPDALPDIITGQSVIHPGVQGVGGWKTDDWLEWLAQWSSTAEETAFTYGFLGHAAADVFSHTYVNTYAGDHFDLYDGEDDVETRHIALESYISSKTPPIADVNGNQLGEASALISTPSEFIADFLIFNDDVSTQYSFASLYHFYYVHELRKKIQTLLDGVIIEIEKELIKAVGESFGIDLNDAQVEEIYSLQTGIKAQINENLEMLQELHLRYFDQIENLVDLQSAFASAANGISSYTVLQSEITSLSGEIEEAQALLSSIDKILSKIDGRECTGGWEKACIVCSAVCGGWSPIIVYYDNPAWIEQNTLLQELIEERSELVEELASVKADVETAISKINEGRVNALNTIDSTFLLMVDLVQIYGGSSNPIRGHLENWRNDIYLGMVAYVDANTLAIKNAMQNEDVLEPFNNWLDCWGRAITTSLPYPVNDVLCKATSEFDNVKAKLEEVRDKLSQLNPAYELLNDLEKKLTEEIENLAVNFSLEIVEMISGIELEDLISAYDEKVSSDQLNNYFATQSGTKKLINIPDIASRVDAEMSLNDGCFDKTKYFVVRNAIVLAKLALLNENGLNALALAAGLNSGTIYGVELYGHTGTAGDTNVLFDAIRSIDGNHQWMPVAPPAVRSDGVDELWPEYRQYGYSVNDDGNSGFRLWQDRGARQKLFLKLFKGPLAPGLEYPNMISMSKVLSADYPYRSCSANPYPISTADQTCIAMWLIPILSILQ